jgi:UDP-N-acetylglucosamine/UDP-N-acetylgalactosamine diphosphorylase
VAGGQGSRLGFEGPKGCFGVTPVQKKSLFEVFAHRILAAQRRYGVVLPWVLMTSPANDWATREFFESHEFFGLKKDQVFFFSQGMLPATDARTGELLLEAPDRLALSPDGHGGAIKGLLKSGALEWLRAKGISTLSYFQVDNPLVQIADEAFVGAHHASGSEFSSKSIAKKDPTEKVGVFAVRDGATTIVEYSDMTPEQTAARNARGELTFGEGNVAIHLLEVSFLEKIATEALLPYHRALKKVSHVDFSGKPVVADKPNAVKFEQFIFDAIPLARLPIVARTTDDEFAPVKNAEGRDSPATARAGQLKRWAEWFKNAGISLPCGPDGVPTVNFEIDPLYADNPSELEDRLASEKDPVPTEGRVYA